MKAEWVAESGFVQVERTAFGVSWAVRAKTLEEVDKIWARLEKDYGDKPGYRKSTKPRWEEE